VSLQHILVVEKDGKRSPLKHWRQDWTFEDAELLEFRGQRSWARRVLSPLEARCTWSQAVFEVDDGPRYEGSGRWTHARGVKPHALARERGTNLYTRQPAEVSLPEATAYWTQAQGFWSEVRQEWQGLFQAHSRFTLRERVDGKSRSDSLFGLADTHQKNPSEGRPSEAHELRQQIRATLDRFVETVVSTRPGHTKEGRGPATP
jgi:hypothetical protein